MALRSELKEASLQRILDAAAVRLREEGLGGAAIASVMRDAGLTHGAFYAHFGNKNDLAIAALRHALVENRQRWVGQMRRESWLQRLARLARRYLNKAHRDDLADSCALATLAGEAARGDDAFRQAYAEELHKSLHGICAGSDAALTPSAQQYDQAIAFMALCVGGMSLARAVADPQFSENLFTIF